MPIFSQDTEYFTAEVGQSNGTTNPVTGAACAILAGQAVTIRNDDGKAYLASAASGATDLPCIGVATTHIANGEMLIVARRGTVREATGIASGLPVFLSDTPGGFSNTAGNTEQLVGFSEIDEEFYLNPDLTVTPSHTNDS